MQTDVDVDDLVADILGKLDRSADRILSQQVTWLGTVARAQRTHLAAHRPDPRDRAMSGLHWNRFTREGGLQPHRGREGSTCQLSANASASPDLGGRLSDA